MNFVISSAVKRRGVVFCAYLNCFRMKLSIVDLCTLLSKHFWSNCFGPMIFIWSSRSSTLSQHVSKKNIDVVSSNAIIIITASSIIIIITMNRTIVPTTSIVSRFERMTLARAYHVPLVASSSSRERCPEACRKFPNDAINELCFFTCLDPPVTARIISFSFLFWTLSISTHPCLIIPRIRNSDVPGSLSVSTDDVSPSHFLSLSLARTRTLVRSVVEVIVQSFVFSFLLSVHSLHSFISLSLSDITV